MKVCKKCVSLMLAILIVLTVMVVGVVPGSLKTEAASWNGYNYRGGTLYGERTFLQAFGIDYDVYMKWLDDHDKDSPNPDYYLGTPYAHNDHRNPRGDCQGAYGEYDSPGVAAMNCTGFVWHVLYKSAVFSGASREQIERLRVMWRVPVSWEEYGIYRIWFDTVEDAYNSGVLEKGDLMWLYGSADNHNAIFYGENPEDFIYWDSAGTQNRYAPVHAIGTSKGVWVAKVTQPNNIELHIDTPSGGKGSRFGTKYMVFTNRSKAQYALDHPDSEAAWDEREGTIVLDSDGHGCFRQQDAPSSSELWSGNTPRTNHSYFNSDARKVDSGNTYYAIQWSHSPGICEDEDIHVFTDSGKRTPSGYRIFRFFAPIKVDTPSFSGIESTSDGVLLKWKHVRDAYKYRVYYRNLKGGWTKMTETKSNSYLDSDVKNNIEYTYTIRCLDQYDNFISDFNESGTKFTYHILNTPSFSSLNSTPEGVQLNWKPVKNTIDNSAVRYRVYYKNAAGGWTMMKETTDTTYTDTDVARGGTYTYTIRCVSANGNFVSRFNRTGWRYTYQGIDTPKITKLVSQADGIKLYWSGTNNVYRYRVYRKTSDGWLRLGETADTEFLDKKVTYGESYIYTIRCINSAEVFVSDYNESGWKITYKGLSVPRISEINADIEGVHLSWKPVDKAVKYRVYRKTSDGWLRLTETADTEYYDADMSPNTEFIYTIRCVDADGNFASDYNADGWKITYRGVATPQSPYAGSEPDGIRLKWQPVENAVKYRVYRKTVGGSWTALADVADTEYLDGAVELNTNYIYTIRCVNTMGGWMSDYNRTGRMAAYSGVETPKFSDVIPEAEGIRLKWNAINGVTAYRVYVRVSDGWKRLTETKGTEYFDTNLDVNTNLVYTIRCVNSSGYFSSDFNANGWKTTYKGVATPRITSLTSTSEGVNIKWSPVEGAVKYRVFYMGRNGWTRLCTVEGTEFLDTDVTAGYHFTYTVRCVGSNDNYISDFDHDGKKIRYLPPSS